MSYSHCACYQQMLALVHKSRGRWPYVTCDAGTAVASPSGPAAADLLVAPAGPNTAICAVPSTKASRPSSSCCLLVPALRSLRLVPHCQVRPIVSSTAANTKGNHPPSGTCRGQRQLLSCLNIRAANGQTRTPVPWGRLQTPEGVP